MLPLHPLLVHAAIALVPALAAGAIVLALREGARWWLRRPLAALAVATLLALFATRWTGERLMESLPQKAAIATHDTMAGVLTVATVPLALLTLLACWVLPGASPLPTGRGALEGRWAGWQPALRVALVVLAVAALVGLVLAGHSGAAAVWVP